MTHTDIHDTGGGQPRSEGGSHVVLNHETSAEAWGIELSSVTECVQCVYSVSVST